MNRLNPRPAGLAAIRLTGCLLWLAAELVACSPTSRSPQTLSIQIDHEPISLDPSLAEDGTAFLMLDPLMHGLFGYSSDGKLENRLAESYRIQDGGKKIEFTLRPHLKWSDGTPLIAEHFVTALTRALSPSSLSKAAPLLYPIQFAREYHQGSVAVDQLGVKSDPQNDRKLTVLLSKATPYLIHLFAHPITLPLRTEILNAHGGTWPEHGPTTGPYRLRQHILNQVYELEKNPEFWGGTIPVQAISFRIVSDESTAIHLFEKGQLDLLTHVSSLDLQRLQKAGLIHTSPYFATYYLSFNCLKPPANNPAWRRSIAQAIQKKQITDVLGGGDLPASSWIPQGLEGYFPYFETQNTASRPQKALPPFIAGFDHSTRNTHVFEVVQENLKKNLGLQIQLAQYDWKSYLKTLQSDPPLLFRMGWMAPISDPVPHLQIFTRNNLNNYSHCFSPAYDQLVTQIEELEPGVKRLELLRQAQDILLNQNVAVIPIYHYVQNNAVARRVQGFSINPFGIISVLQIHFN